MDLEQAQTYQPQQNIAITASLITSLKILQLSSEELEHAIEQEIVDNPALEVEERATCSICGAALDDGRCAECGHMMESSTSDPDMPEEFDESWRLESAPNPGTEEDYDLVSLVASETSISDYLLEALLSAIGWEDAPIAEYLIGSLDESGYLTASDEEVAEACGMTVERVHRVVQALQQQDPPGVGARSPLECLQIQLRRLAEDGKGDQVAARILDECFEELGQHKFDLIASRLGVKADAVFTSWAFIKDNLTPFPAWGAWQGMQRMNTSNGYVRPDVAIRSTEDGYVVEVLEELRYRFGVNQVYDTLLDQTDLPREDRDFVRKHTSQAKFFISFVKQRWETIRQISACIVEAQQDFLDHGIRHLKPLTRAEVANRVGLHESTVSRATTNKYMMLPSKHVISFDDVFDGSLAIKDAIREIIAGEDAIHPMSDEEIAAVLKEQGMFLARRTVAKYRGALRILPSALRSRAYQRVVREPAAAVV